MNCRIIPLSLLIAQLAVLTRLPVHAQDGAPPPPPEIYATSGDAALKIFDAVSAAPKARAWLTTISEPYDLWLHILMLVSAVMAIGFAWGGRRLVLAWIATLITLLLSSGAMCLRTLQATYGIIYWQGHDSFEYLVRDLLEAPQPFYAGAATTCILALAIGFSSRRKQTRKVA